MSIPLPAPAIRLHGKRGKQISPELIGFFDDGQMHAHAAAVSADRDAQIAALRAEVVGLREDAERYRWLRNNPEWLGWDHDFRPDEVEREIDAARKGTTPGSL